MIVTVDITLFTVIDNKINVAIIQRDRDPFKNNKALPGGFVHENEDNSIEDTAYRVIKDKMCINSPYLEQLGTFSGKKRDPRDWSLSVVYFALIPFNLIEANNKYEWMPINKLNNLPFDHLSILNKALQRVKAKAEYTAIPAYLLPEKFTLSELQKMYELLQNEKLDKSSFRRKLSELDFLVELDEYKIGHHRPAKLYCLKNKDLSVFKRKV